MRRSVRLTVTTTAVLALGLGAASCGEDLTDTADPDTGDTGVTTTDDVADDVAVESVVGLEVTAVGNVSDRLSDEAIRIDRDGLGATEDKGEVGVEDPGSYDYDYDYDYDDYDYLTEYDEDYGDDALADEGVLVVDAAGLRDVEVDEEVRVSGTLRRFDQSLLESLYEIELEDDVFDDYEDSLVIVADSVRRASSAAASSG